ncbi:MAG TPA: carbon-nitrogen hydrolase family protein [Kosmotoga arenicorallina]|uniref:Carbon-nitrogen hydrolase family protein n=1 Tax=Kosmotoga arenicorallina TaxID=688066 RepID=A0A7C5DWR9_9BACT|nr:carbon-nitrogen hydrolase family protein [Kosmotoga arenicorallina]
MKVSKKRTKINVGAIQLFSAPDNPGENLERAITYMELLIEKGVDLILLPEMFNTGYGTSKEILNSAMDIFDETIESLSAVADFNDVAIVGGIPRKSGNVFYNSTVVVLPYNEPLFYNKTHLFRKEKEVFKPGQSLLVFNYLGVEFGIFMCYEVGFPEIARTLAKRGAQVFLAPFAFGKERERIYEIATRARAIENGSFLMAANQIEKGSEMEYLGKSRIISPDGNLLADAGNAEGIIWATLNLAKVNTYRYTEQGTSHGYFANFREDLYE